MIRTWAFSVTEKYLMLYRIQSQDCLYCFRTQRLLESSAVWSIFQLSDHSMTLSFNELKQGSCLLQTSTTPICEFFGDVLHEGITPIHLTDISGMKLD